MKQKKFDCVKMKDQAQAEVLRRLSALPLEEQMAYWQKRNQEFRQWHSKAAGQSGKTASHTKKPRKKTAS